MTLTLEPRATTYPVPAGRGRWRLTVHRRVFSVASTWEASLVTELPRARGRRLDLKWDTAAQATFTLDGRADEAALITELQHDCVFWRWDETAGVDRPMFRGIIGQSEDQLTEDGHTVTFTCHDYYAMLSRRFNQNTYTVTQRDQDDIVGDLLTLATASAGPSAGGTFAPGSYLPLAVQLVNPDGTARAKSGVLRDRTYPAQSDLGGAVAALGAVQGGYDFDVLPMGMANHETDALRIFYPRQGVTQTLTLNYGGNVATVTRAVSSSDYANYTRRLGNNPSGNTAAGQLYGEAYNADASGVVVGLWSMGNNAADVSVAATLGQQAAGDLAYYGTLMPSYTLGLTPGWYQNGLFSMGDVVNLVVMSGRLKVTAAPSRIVGISFALGDDGDENVALTVGRPTQSLADLIKATDKDVDALVRR